MGTSFNIETAVAGVAAGDAASFAWLYEHLVDRVYPFVVSRTKRSEHALDVTQDTFIALHQSLKRFVYQSDPAFYSFVFTIVRRQLAQYYERERKQDTDSFDEAAHGGYDPKHVEQLAVEEALKTLDPQTCEILVLHHWSRFTFGEIAAMLGLEESAVRVRHHRAKKELHAHFQIQPV